LARAFVHSAKTSDVSLSGFRAGEATRLARQFLVEVAEAVAAEAAELGRLGLKVAYSEREKSMLHVCKER
jgi:hypothetical protein